MKFKLILKYVFIPRIFITSILFLLLACSSSAEPMNSLTADPIDADPIHVNKKLSFSPDYPIYLSDQSKYDFANLNRAFDKVFSFKKPVLFFIHGRGKEPNKSLNGGTFVEGNAVPKLEEQYGVKVILFNWDSEASFYDRTKPLGKMKDSAASLNKVLIALESYLNLNPSKKISLLAQSMGSIVVQTHIENLGWNFKRKIFENFLLTSPDANNLNHHLWLNKLTRNENVYISINKDDSILSKSTDDRPKGVGALGNKPVKPFADKAIYIDLTKMGGNPGEATKAHEVFNKPNMNFQKNVCDVFQSLISSEKPLLSQTTTVAEEKNYLRFNFNINENTSCFKF